MGFELTSFSYAIIMYFSSPYMNKEKLEIGVDGL